MSLLEVKNLTKHFGRLAALDGINLKFAEGELVGLVGPNGSGKTTLFNIISGRYHPTAGEIIYKGEKISGLRPDQIARKGITRAFQANVLFQDATVLENVVRGCFPLRNSNLGQAFFNTKAYRKEEREIIGQTDEWLRFWGLSERRDQLAGSLPHGLQRVLGLAMAAAARPSLVLLDEPMTGMGVGETAPMCDHIKRINGQGATVILVEHNVKSVMSICSRLVVLNFGQKIADGAPQEVIRNKDVITAYLGKGVV